MLIQADRDHFRIVPEGRAGTVHANGWRRIAVGPPITGRPAHRSERARFGHSAPTLGVDVNPLKHAERRRSLASRLAVCAPAPVTRFSGAVPGTCFAGSHSPRSPRFAPPAPRPVARLCSSASSLLWRSLTSQVRASLATAPRLPNADQRMREWPDLGPPGSRAKSFGTCQVLRPRRAAKPCDIVLGCVAFRLRNSDPYRRFVDALMDGNARLGADVVRYSFIVSDFHRLLLAGLPAHFVSDLPSHTVGSPQPGFPVWGKHRCFRGLGAVAQVSDRQTGRSWSQTGGGTRESAHPRENGGLAVLQLRIPGDGDQSFQTMVITNSRRAIADFW